MRVFFFLKINLYRLMVYNGVAYGFAILVYCFGNCSEKACFFRTVPEADPNSSRRNEQLNRAKISISRQNQSRFSSQVDI